MKACKVKDDVKVRVMTAKGRREFDAEITYAPNYYKGADAIQVFHHGFKQAGIINPKQVERYGTYEMMLRFLEYFFGTFMGYGDCEVVGFSEGEPQVMFENIVIQTV